MGPSPSASTSCRGRLRLEFSDSRPVEGLRLFSMLALPWPQGPLVISKLKQTFKAHISSYNQGTSPRFDHVRERTPCRSQPTLTRYKGSRTRRSHRHCPWPR